MFSFWHLHLISSHPAQTNQQGTEYPRRDRRRRRQQKREGKARVTSSQSQRKQSSPHDAYRPVVGSFGPPFSLFACSITGSAPTSSPQFLVAAPRRVESSRAHATPIPTLWQFGERRRKTIASSKDQTASPGNGSSGFCATKKKKKSPFVLVRSRTLEFALHEVSPGMTWLLLRPIYDPSHSH